MHRTQRTLNSGCPALDAPAFLGEGSSHPRNLLLPLRLHLHTRKTSRLKATAEITFPAGSFYRLGKRGTALLRRGRASRCPRSAGAPGRARPEGTPSRSRQDQVLSPSRDREAPPRRVASGSALGPREATSRRPGRPLLGAPGIPGTRAG